MKTKAAILIFLALSLFFLWKLGWLEITNLSFVQERHLVLLRYVEANFAFSIIVFFFIYLFTAALSLPAATVLTLVAGAVFGLFVGTILVSFASTLGAVASMMLSRFLFRGWAERRFQSLVARVNQGFSRDGWPYLLMLRLLPAMPYVVCNFLMGLTKISVWQFALISQIGMLPATLIYVNAGTRLAEIRKVSDVLTPKIALALSILGLFPVLAKLGLKEWKRRGHIV